MDSSGLAEKARALRRAADLTQQQLAERLVEAGYAEKLSVAAISLAENPATETDMTKLRVAIIEHLTGKKLSGPVWFFEEEAL